MIHAVMYMYSFRLERVVAIVIRKTFSPVSVSRFVIFVVNGSRRWRYGTAQSLKRCLRRRNGGLDFCEPPLPPPEANLACPTLNTTLAHAVCFPNVCCCLLSSLHSACNIDAYNNVLTASVFRPAYCVVLLVSVDWN